MNTELIGILSGLIVILSVIPYAWGTWKERIEPNIMSWSVWTVIGLSLLVTYHSSGAKDNLWPALFGFTNPLLITILAIMKKGESNKFGKLEWICLLIALISLIMWAIMRGSKELVQYALYVGILADSGAAIPTIVFVWKNPMKDRPFAWVLFSVGYSFSMLAVTEHTLANYSLPIYMTLGSLSVAIPLILIRIKNKIPLKEWV